MALHGTTNATSNRITYTWTIENPAEFKLDPVLYSDVFESEPDICWQAVFEQCSDGTKKCGLKFLGCSVLGPVFPLEVEFECYVKGPPDQAVVRSIIKTFDWRVDEYRETTSKDSCSLKESRLNLSYRITTRKYANFTIPRSRLLADLPPKSRVLTGVNFFFTACESLKAHMEVLAARSSVFAAMFNADMMEKQQTSVTISDIRIEVFRHLLEFIHTDKAQPSEMLVPELLAAAEKYDLARLKAACERALLRGVSVSTAIKTLYLADKHNAQQLKNHTLDFIVTNSSKVLIHGWEALVRGHPQLLLDIYQAMAKK